jgi:acyl-lipid omega-6 desaturase (Delta-12 desaturase)
MGSDVTSTSAGTRRWVRLLGRYRDPSLGRSSAEIAITAFPLVLLFIAMWTSVHHGYWLALALTVPAAAFLVRLFMIQHDCSHGAFFRSRILNDWVGRSIGVLTLTPHDQWRRTHAAHHAGIGNLERRGIGDIRTLTVGEYAGMSRWRRFGYRLYRHPVVLFGLGPAFLFLLQNRVPISLKRGGWRAWLSPMATNIAILAASLILIQIVGIWVFLAVQLPVAILAGTAGVWLFYVQHQFEETSWEGEEDWTHPDASLHGSSFYDLPQPLRWFSANIGVHHVHHLNSRIPFYRLTEVLRTYPELTTIGRLTLLTSLRCVPLVLWDEERKRLISFREMRLNAAAARS